MRDQGDVRINTDQQQLYEMAFARYGVRIRDFLEMLKVTNAQWIEYPPHTFIVRKGDEMPLLWYLIEGEVESVATSEHHTHLTVKPGKGGWLGELWDPNAPNDYWQQPHHWHTGFRALQPSRVVAFDRKKMHDFIKSSPQMRDAAEAAEIADLWGKLKNSFKQGNRNVYTAMRQVALADGELEPDEREVIDHFVARNTHDLENLPS